MALFTGVDQQLWIIVSRTRQSLPIGCVAAGQLRETTLEFPPLRLAIRFERKIKIFNVFQVV